MKNEKLEIERLYRATRNTILFPTIASMEDFIYRRKKMSYTSYLSYECITDGDYCMVLNITNSSDKKYKYINILTKENTGWIFDCSGPDVILESVVKK